MLSFKETEHVHSLGIHTSKKDLIYMGLKTTAYWIEHTLRYKYESPCTITLNLGLKYTSTTEMNKL